MEVGTMEKGTRDENGISKAVALKKSYSLHLLSKLPLTLLALVCWSVMLAITLESQLIDPKREKREDYSMEDEQQMRKKSKVGSGLHKHCARIIYTVVVSNEFEIYPQFGIRIMVQNIITPASRPKTTLLRYSQ
jgi:hypothetical protein